MNTLKLKKARKKIDIIDNSIFNLIKKRTAVVNQMIKLKKYKNQIVDKKRMKTILKKIRLKSKKNKIDPNITETIWKSIIWSYVMYQRKNFKKK